MAVSIAVWAASTASCASTTASTAASTTAIISGFCNGRASDEVTIVCNVLDTVSIAAADTTT